MARNVYEGYKIKIMRERIGTSMTWAERKSRAEASLAAHRHGVSLNCLADRLAAAIAGDVDTIFRAGFPEAMP